MYIRPLRGRTERLHLIFYKHCIPSGFIHNLHVFEVFGVAQKGCPLFFYKDSIPPGLFILNLISIIRKRFRD